MIIYRHSINNPLSSLKTLIRDAYTPAFKRRDSSAAADLAETVAVNAMAIALDGQCRDLTSGEIECAALAIEQQIEAIYP